MINENKKQKFIDICKSLIKRNGADKLIEYLEKTDFFTAPASTKYHGSFEGGLLEHSLNVYNCLTNHLSSDRVRSLYNLMPTIETIAIVSLFHDICKVNCYKATTRNVKENGVWVQVPAYEYIDNLPYGHGEKSVYMLSGFMVLTREEAFSIRYHMGFSGTKDKRNIGAAFQQYPLAFALSIADMESTYFMENIKENADANE